MKEVAHNECQNILELVETFDDEEFIYVSTKF